MVPSVFVSIHERYEVMRRYTEGQLVSQPNPSPKDTIPIWVVRVSASTMLRGPPMSPVQGPPLPPSAQTWSSLTWVGKRVRQAKLVITLTLANCRLVLRSEREEDVL